jgi:scyllo-inositol 2-dehydrogenase (NADP+)
VPVAPRQALDVMRIIELAQRSAKEGRTVTLS